MKRYISILFFFSLILICFLSCSSNDQNISYEDQVLVQEKIAGQWTLESILYESNYEKLAADLNELSKSLSDSDNIYFTFQTDSLQITSIAKNNLTVIEDKSYPYTIANGNIYVYDMNNNQTYTYKYTLGDSSLSLKTTLSQTDISKILNTLSSNDSIYYSIEINNLPTDLSLDRSFILKR